MLRTLPCFTCAYQCGVVCGRPEGLCAYAQIILPTQKCRTPTLLCPSWASAPWLVRLRLTLLFLVDIITRATQGCAQLIFEGMQQPFLLRDLICLAAVVSSRLTSTLFIACVGGLVLHNLTSSRPTFAGGGAA